MKITVNNGFYTVVLKDCEVHFFTAWECISFLANINLTVQMN